METCVLLSARKYDFNDDAGKRVEGVTISYLTGDVETTGDRRGAAPLTINAPSEVFALLGPLPGLYDVDFKQRAGKNNRPTLMITGVQFRTALDGLLGSVQPLPAPVKP
jgi:hypothetical protein